MKSTLSLKKPLSLEQQAKLFQMMGLRDELPKKQQQKESEHVSTALKKRRFDITIDWLANAFPLCFDPKNPKPLKKGILRDILKQDIMDEIKNFFKRDPYFLCKLPSLL